MEIVKKATKGAVLLSNCSKELKKLIGEYQANAERGQEIVDRIYTQAYKDGLGDTEVRLILQELVKPMEISQKRKDAILKPFRDPRPLKLPSPDTPILADEIIDVWFPFTILNLDVNRAKRNLLQVIEESRDGMWIQMKRSRTEVTGIIGDNYKELV